MAKTALLPFLSEADVLKQAARLVDSGDLEQAVKLLSDAHRTKPRSEKLLGVLSNLHYQLGEPDIAREYAAAVFEGASPSESQAELCLPSESDFAFLYEQSSEFEENEYSFERHEVERETSPRKILSLKQKKESAFDEGDSSVKIFYKGRYSYLPTPASQSNNENETESSETVIPTAQANKPEKNDDTNIRVLEESVTTAEPINESQIHDTEREEYLLGEVEQQWEAGDLDILDVLADEVDSDEDTFEVSIFSEREEDSDASEESLCFEDTEIDIYAFWDAETLDDEVEDSADSDVLDNQLTPEERARLIAVECVVEFGWNTSKLSFLVEVFTGAGWNNSRKALEREVQAGATCEELELALEVKKLWQDSSRYWITLSKAWVSGESAEATYRHFSWKQALRLVRLFNGLPTFEELHDFLETEFDYWYHNSLLRRCFPAFNKYLFNYRFHDRNINSLIGGFDIPIAYDGMNATWSYHTHTNEMLKLNEMGIDLISRFTTKSYFTSDIYTKDYLLEMYHASAKSQQGGTD